MLDKDFFSRYNDVHGKNDETAPIPGFQMNRPVVAQRVKGRIGLELEIESRSPTPNEGHLDALVAPTTKAKWMAIRDGSLRGDYAREYIVNKPINRDELRYMLEGLFDNFKLLKSKLDNSNRCSTHVHLNMGGKKINEITAVMCLWTVFEQALIAYNGEERMTNHFALSSTESNATLTAWENYLRYGNPQFDRNLKYQAMNVLPIFEKGSLEIRCGAAANNAEDPILWATLLDHMVDYAVENYGMISRMGGDLSERGGIHIFTELCGRDPILSDKLLPRVVDVSGGVELFNDSCLHGFRNCQPLVFGFPWEAWHKLIEKEYIPDPFAKEAPVKYRAGAARPRLFGEAIPVRGDDFRAQARQALDLANGGRVPPPEVWNPRPIEGPRDRDERDLYVGARVSYSQGAQRRPGALGIVARIDHTASGNLRIWVRWDEDPAAADLRWLGGWQLRLVEAAVPDIPVEVEEEDDEDDDWIGPIEEEDEDDDF